MKKSRKTRGRNVHGVLLLDKPIGMTSNRALQHVKHLFQARKAGHTGSLDSQASGLLPLCFGEATKVSGYLLNSDKLYQSVFKLGVVTSTGDAIGETVSVNNVPEFEVQDIEKVLSKFRGKISQTPPMHSALKHKGQRLYKLAYQGIEVERKSRTVFIHELTLLGHCGDQIEVKVHCSKGTYIRTLAEDIGEILGCGAHVSSLRRQGVGPFHTDQMISMSEIEQKAELGLEELDQYLLAVDSVLINYPDVKLSENLAYYINQGQAVMVPHSPTEGLVRIYNHNQDFIGVGEVLDDGRIAPRRLIQCETLT